jgi:hypothetical protein
MMKRFCPNNMAQHLAFENQVDYALGLENSLMDTVHWAPLVNGSNLARDIRLRANMRQD